MSKVFASVLLLSGLFAAGAVYAWGGSSSSDMKSSSDMNSLSSSQVKAAIVSKAGDTVRIYAPDNKVLCKGDLIPVFSSSGTEGIAPMERQPSGTMERQFRGTSNLDTMISKADLSNMNLVGEVRVDNLIGDNYAEGKLIVGDAGHGDIATKPSSECLKQPVPGA